MLNKEQKEAVECIDKPLIVIAGPGTGKTTLICEKVNYLISEKNYAEDEILALTFTQKAAEEMSQRVENISKKPFSAKTFHSFALELIEEYSSDIAQIDKNYKLIEENDIVVFFLENLDEINFKSIEIKNNRVQIAQDLASSMLKLKDFDISLSELDSMEVEECIMNDLKTSYKLYEKFKEKNNFIDFADILLYLLRFLEKDEKARGEIRKKYKYILVDEFQDTNKVQLEILKLLSSENITIVGDQKQSIYGFRGANYKNLEDFKTHFFNFREIYLHENYRSSKNLVKTFNKLIGVLTSKKEILNSTKTSSGQIDVVKCTDESSQFSFILKKISQLQHSNPDAKIGLLTRRKSEGRLISKKLEEFGIENINSHNSNFLENESVKLLISLLEVVSAPKEVGSDIYVLMKFFSIRNETIRKICRKSSMKKISIFEILKNDDDLDYVDEQTLIQKLVKAAQEIMTKKNSGVSLKKLAMDAATNLKLYEKCIAANNIESVNAINLFLEFVEKFSYKYDNNLEKFLSYLRKCSTIENDNLSIENTGCNVYVMTVHQSKGMEFDYVFIPYLNERKFPSNANTSKFDILSSQKDEILEEEKRLFFVALTRAKESLYLSYVKRYSSNKFDSKPSPFLSELELKEILYEEKLESFKMDNKNEIKFDILKKIQKLIYDDEYDLVRKEIDLLKNLFGKRDLNSYISSSEHPDYKLYDERLKGKNNFLVNVNPEAMMYSVSQLKTYESCPQKYLYQYIYKIPTEKKHYFDFGTSVHAVLEEIIPKFNSMPKEALYAIAVKLLHEKWISKGYESAQQEREYFEKGVSAIKDFIEREEKLKKEDRNIVSLEEKFIIEIDGKKLIGFIDRIDKIGEDFEIIDYKTSNTMETKSQLSENMQLYVYAMALKEKFGKYPKKIGLWYLVHDKLSTIDFDKSSVENVKSEVKKLISGIEKKDFDPKPSFFSCKFCDFNKICNHKDIE